MSSYAIVETGSKQYRVEAGQVIEVERLQIPEANPKQISLDQVLLFRDGERLEIGLPLVKGAQILCEYLGNVKGEKVVSFKYRRRKASKTKKGHRQQFSRLRVKEIKV